MKNFCVVLGMLTLVLIGAGMAGAATTVWNPAAAGVYPPAVGNWGDAANWTAGVPGLGTDGGSDKAVFNVTDAAECVISEPQTCKDYVQGEGGPGGVVRVVNGGKLTLTGGWMAVGYNNTAELIVEEGGECDFAGHLWWGMNAGSDGVIKINGGKISNGQNFSLGWNGGDAHVFVNDGELNIHHWAGYPKAIAQNSTMDIKFGTVIIGGNRVGDIDKFIDDGKLTAFGGISTLVYDYNETNPGKTTITAIDPMNPSPVGIKLPAGEIELNWTNLAPTTEGDSVYVDVWFGTDPNKLNPAVYSKQIEAGQDVSSVNVDASVAGTYYWQVDSYLEGADAINEPNMTVGRVYSFTTTDDTPPSVVIETPDTLTWAGEPVQLDATITDDGTSPLTIVWSVDPAVDPNVTFLPSPNVEDPIITGDSHLGHTLVTVTVGDATNPEAATATMVVDIAESACQGARGGFPRLDLVYTADLDGNCIVNLLDFQVLTSQWLDPYELTEPIPIETGDVIVE